MTLKAFNNASIDVNSELTPKAINVGSKLTIKSKFLHIQWQTNTISSYRIQHVRNLQNQHIHFHTSMANQYFHFTYKEDQPLQNQHTLPHIQWQTNTISSYRIQHGKRPQNQHIHFHTSMENYKNTLSTLS